MSTSLLIHKCYQLSLYKAVTSFTLNLEISETGQVAGTANLTITGIGSAGLPVTGTSQSTGNGHEISLNLDGSSKVPGIEGIQIQLITDDEYNGISATYTVTTTIGKFTSPSAPAQTIPCP